MDDIKGTVRNQRAYYDTGATKDLNFRLGQLGSLKRAIQAHEKEIMDALRKDLNRDPFDTYAAEIGIVLEEVNYLIRHLPRWGARKRVRTSPANFLASSYIYPEPYGIALILSP